MRLSVLRARASHCGRRVINTARAKIETWEGGSVTGALEGDPWFLRYMCMHVHVCTDVIPVGYINPDSVP